MKPIYLLLLIFLLTGCRHEHEITPLFRWNAISPQSDSIVVALERCPLNDEPFTTRIRLVRQLDSIATATGSRQIKARALYFGAIAARYSPHSIHDSTRLQMINQALCLTDSAKYPYDYHRIRYLGVDLKQTTFIERYREYLSILDYFKSIDDSYMQASVEMEVGHLAKTIGDPARALRYYMYADSIYGELGITSYRLKNKLNIAAAYRWLDRARDCEDILRDLTKHPAAKRNKDFYITLLLTTYSQTEDNSFLQVADSIVLLEGYNGKNLSEYWFCKSNPLLVSGEYKQAATMLKTGVHHLHRMHANQQLDYKRQAYTFLSYIYEQQGMADSALYYTKMLASLQDSIIEGGLALKFASGEDRRDLATVEKSLKDRQRLMQLVNGFIILVIISLALGIVLTLLRRIQRNKLELKESKAEIEKQSRSLVSQTLVMTEKDNVLQSVLKNMNRKEAGQCGEGNKNLEQMIKMHLNGQNDWDCFKELFEKVHPSFVSGLKAEFPDLTESNLRLATYIKAGMESKQIARMTNLQPDTIRKNRQKLRHHLGLTRDESLENFLRFRQFH